MYSKPGNPNQQFYGEYDIEEEEELESDGSEKYVETEVPQYVSIADKIPVIDFKNNPNAILNQETNEEEEDQNSTNNEYDVKQNSIFPTQPESHTSSSTSISYNNKNNCNTDSTDNISTTAVNDNQSSNSNYDGFSSPDCNENTYGILDFKPCLFSVPPFFNEPSTIEAMERLGYVQSDLLPSDYSQVPGNEEIRYKIIIELEKRRIQMIEDVINEREKVLKGIPEKESKLSKKSLSSKVKHKKKVKRKVKKVKKKKKNRIIKESDDDNSTIGEAEHPTPRRKRRAKKKKQVIEDDNSFTVSKPAFTRKNITQKELTADEIRRKRIEETIKLQQKKNQLEIERKTEETEKRLKMQHDQKLKEANELKQKRLQRKKEIESLKKENELKKQRAAQKALKKIDEVEMRQAQIRKQKLDEIQRKKEIREQRLMRAQAEKKRQRNEQLRDLNLAMEKSERKSGAIGLTSKTKKKQNRATAKIIVPQVPQRHHNHK